MVAVTVCDHAVMCPRCALRNRLCFGNRRCPICQTESATVVIASYADSQRESFTTLRRRATGGDGRTGTEKGEEKGSSARRKSGSGSGHVAGAKGVVVDVQQHVGGETHRYIAKMISLTCSICDPHGKRYDTYTYTYTCVYMM